VLCGQSTWFGTRGRRFGLPLDFAFTAVGPALLGYSELYDLTREAPFFRARLELEYNLPSNIEVDKIIEQLAEVSEKFRKELRMPSDFRVEQIENLGLLLEIAKKGTAELPVNSLSATLVKESTRQPQILGALEQESTFRIDLTNYSLPLLNDVVEIGPCSIIFERASIANPEKVKKDYLTAKDGEGVVIQLVPRGRVKLISPQILVPQHISV
jgi:hypothetical protein